MAKHVEEYRVAYVGGIQHQGRVMRQGERVPDGFFTPEQLDGHLAGGLIERRIIEVPDEREVKAFLSDGTDEQSLETTAPKRKRKR